MKAKKKNIITLEVEDDEVLDNVAYLLFRSPQPGYLFVDSLNKLYGYALHRIDDMELDGVAWGILDPRDTYQDRSKWEEKAKDLAARFIKNFGKYTTNAAGQALVAAGPQL